MPCGLIVLFILPNYPSARSGKRWYLTDEEFELAQQRMIRVKRVQTTGLMNFTVLKSIFTRWHVYLLPLVYIFYGESVSLMLRRLHSAESLQCQSFEYFGIWLKNSAKYGKDPIMINILPTFGKVVQLVFTILWGFLSDYTGKSGGVYSRSHELGHHLCRDPYRLASLDAAQAFRIHRRSCSILHGDHLFVVGRDMLGGST